MKKIFLISTILLFVSGCGVKYELNIKNNSIVENINFSLEKKGIVSDSDLETSYESDFFIDSMVNSEIPVIENDEPSDNNYYDKKVTQDGNIYNFSLSYEYKNNDYINSRVVNVCFEKHEIRLNDNKSYIHLNGKFNCYQDEPIEITIKSENKIKKANGKKSGNSYTWTIDESNYENVDIEIETSDEPMTRYYIYIGIIVIIGIIVLVFIFNFVRNMLSRNSINEV